MLPAHQMRTGLLLANKAICWRSRRCIQGYYPPALFSSSCCSSCTCASAARVCARCFMNASCCRPASTRNASTSASNCKMRLCWDCQMWNQQRSSRWRQQQVQGPRGAGERGMQHGKHKTGGCSKVQMMPTDKQHSQDQTPSCMAAAC